MKCTKCSLENPERTVRCEWCGHELYEEGAAEPTISLPETNKEAVVPITEKTLDALKQELIFLKREYEERIRSFEKRLVQAERGTLAAPISAAAAAKERKPTTPQAPTVASKEITKPSPQEASTTRANP